MFFGLTIADGKGEVRLGGKRSLATSRELKANVTPPHSITKSAEASSVGGTSIPSALAVFRLTAV